MTCPASAPRHVQIPDGATCFECDLPAQHMHHVVPFVAGGRRTLPLCEKCHGTVHGLQMAGHGAATRAGLDAARARGQVLGAPPMGARVVDGQRVEDPAVVASIARIRALRAEGKSYASIASALNEEHAPTAKGGRWHVRTVRVALGLEASAAG